MSATAQPRTLGPGDAGADVALLQVDLNGWLRSFGAPGNARLSRDGCFGARTAAIAGVIGTLAGLELADGRGAIAVSPRARAVIRHVGRSLVAARRGAVYELPPVAARTVDEIARAGAAGATEVELLASLDAARAAAGRKRAAVELDVGGALSRHGRHPRVVVLHCSQAHRPSAVSDLDALAQRLAADGERAGAHVGNDADGRDGRFAADIREVASVASHDVVALHLEQVGTQDAWPAVQLQSTAAWLAFWSQCWGIPLVNSTEHGVCQHSDLEPDATDCGPAYPLDYVLQLAAAQATAAGWPGAAPADGGPDPDPSTQYTLDALRELAAAEERWLQGDAPDDDPPAPPAPPAVPALTTRTLSFLNRSTLMEARSPWPMTAASTRSSPRRPFLWPSSSARARACSSSPSISRCSSRPWSAARCRRRTPSSGRRS